MRRSFGIGDDVVNGASLGENLESSEPLNTVSIDSKTMPRASLSAKSDTVSWNISVKYMDCWTLPADVTLLPVLFFLFRLILELLVEDLPKLVDRSSSSKLDSMGSLNPLLLLWNDGDDPLRLRFDVEDIGICRVGILHSVFISSSANLAKKYIHNYILPVHIHLPAH